MMPALLTTMSTRPNRLSAVSMIAAAPSSVDTSFVSPTARPPAATISSATVRAGVASVPTPSFDPPRSFTTTLAPRAASNVA